MPRLLGALVLACLVGPWALAETASERLAMRKTETSGLAPNWYGAVELRHHLNTYYDEDGYLGPQEPSVHARLQAGAQLYGGLLDAYATFGVYKVPRTQKITQRRTELALDVYPFRNPYVTILQYNLVQLPFEERELDDKGEEISSQSGSIYTIGLAPELHYPISVGATTFKMKLGADGWTRLYSRRQYTEDYTYEADDGDGHFSLGPDAEQEPIEDTMNHYRVVYMSGFSVEPSFLPDLYAEATANYDNRFRPRYVRTDSGIEHEYAADRSSFYRLRLKYDLTPRVAVLNDFYHFHGGFFEEKRDGENRRFRNIFRMTCWL